MTDDPRVDQLLEELLDSGDTPEQVCHSCPELLPQVRAGLRRLEQLEAEVGALFPLSDTPRDGAPTTRPVGEPPHIPDYDVQGTLGRGGMAVVYRAVHVRLNRPVALKMLLAGADAEPEELERFLREAEAVAGLRHPNVVPVYDIGEADGRSYFTMELVEGGTLAGKLAGTPLPAGDAAVLVATLADAVGAAHAAGIIHRDLKPANVLLAADGTPKVSDFGLARRMEGGSGLTRSGAMVGTPSYMAPEQARGEAGAAGPAADVYALGAILYECLTGRPPFKAESALETVMQLTTQEPVSPARLNTRVPRDLETICLKCLEKDPHRRYPSAAALADDLRRFLGGEPIAARPPAVLERGLRWVRRRPALAAESAAGLLLALALGGVGLWWYGQRTAAVASAVAVVEVELNEVERLQTKYDFAGAEAALKRARLRLGEIGPAELHGRLAQSSRDLELVRRLDAVRLDRVGVKRDSPTLYAVEQQNDKESSGRRYEDAFREAGLGTVQEDPAAVAARVKASPVWVALVAALDDWAVCKLDRDRRAWVLAVARLADPDAWRDRVRDPRTWEDNVVLHNLAATARVAEQSSQLLVALGGRLERGEAATDFWTRVVLAHPNDFWVHVECGRALTQTFQWGEASGHYQTALAIRPRAAPVHFCLGTLLMRQHRLAEAISHLEHAVDLDASEAFYHIYLAEAYQQEGRRSEAIAHYREALRLRPQSWTVHLSLGTALECEVRIDEAVEEYRKPLPQYRSTREFWYTWYGNLVMVGRGDEVRRAWQKDLAASPRPVQSAWYGYAELCLFLGQEEEYRRARRDLLAHFGGSTNPGVAALTSLACLLLPAAEDELRQAVASAGRAAATLESKHKAGYPYLLIEGLADYRQGRFKKAIAVLGEVKVPDPSPHPMLASRLRLDPSARLVLAMSQHRGGQKEQARKTLAAAVASFDWRARRADSPEVWVSHVLRREAEALILPDLPAFLEGKHDPLDNDDRLALLGACEFLDRPAAAARLCAAAFAADPKLAEDPRGELRYRAACAAARAAVGVGDGAGLDEDERARWREQSRAWLRAELDTAAGQLKGGTLAQARLVMVTLNGWPFEADLAPFLGQNALDKLPPAEAREWLALWRDFGAQYRLAHHLVFR